MIRIALLLFVLTNMSYAQGRLDVTYGKNTEDLGVNFWQTQYLGNTIGVEYTHTLGKRWSVTSGLGFAGWYASEWKQNMIDNPENSLICGFGCCGVGVSCFPDRMGSNPDFSRYGSKRLELPLMVNYRMGKHEKLPFALRVGLRGVVNRIYVHDWASVAILDKSFNYRMQADFGFQIPVLRTAKIGFFLEPYGRMGKAVQNPSQDFINVPFGEMIFDYGLKLGISLY